MYKSLITASMLFIATTAHASDPKDWCPTLLKQADMILSRQTDSDLEGKVEVPGSVPKEDGRAYRKLIKRARSLVKRYNTQQLPKEVILNILKSDCSDIYNPTRNGAL